MGRVDRWKWLAVSWAFALVVTAFSGGNEPLVLPPPPRLAVADVQLISAFTGPESPSQTDEPWNVYGTDLGFSFDDGDTTYIIFGDTWGRDGVEGSDWRSNIMGVVEPDPVHGYVLTDFVTNEQGEAIELLSSLKQAEQEYTVIPNGAVMVDDRIYLHYISVNDWDKKWWGYKFPVPNGSGIAYSDDGGRTWTKDPDAVWQGNSPFAHAALVQEDGYVFMFGTPAGRFGPATLLRVDEDEVLDPEEWEYWTGTDWSSDARDAADIVPPPVGELSLRWSDVHDQWFMMYKNEVSHTIVLRTAPELTGPWSEERLVADSDEYPSLYAPGILPITSDEIYFTMSRFKPYQVFLMKMTLTDDIIQLHPSPGELTE